MKLTEQLIEPPKMISAPIPANESGRLDALRSYEVLDSQAEKDFDDLIQLASKICNVPISLVSLVDMERQWFKAKLGIDAAETGRDVAFCAHAILGNDVFEVPDATKDERFAGNPLVTSGPEIRFYAGMPLTTPEGYNIGTLCVIDTTPKNLTEEQKSALQTIARQVIAQLELRMQLKMVKAKTQALTESINYAKGIQEAIMPEEEEIKKHFKDAFHLNKPKDILSGDFTWVHSDEEYTYFALADCTGHGVPGSIMTVLCTQLLTEIILQQKVNDLTKVITALDKGIRRTLNQKKRKSADGMDFTIIRHNKTDKSITIVSTRQSVFCFENNELVEIKGDRESIGGEKNHEMKLSPTVINDAEGVSLVLMSDGWKDQFGGPADKKYGKERIVSMLTNTMHLEAAQQKAEIEKDIISWIGKGKQIDDISVARISF